MKEVQRIIDAYDSIDWSRERCALGTVVHVEESSYRRIGARMLVLESGVWVGGISGGCLEGDALKRAKIAIAKNESSKVVYNTMEDDAHQIGVGLGCNGIIEVLFTPIDANNKKNAIEILKSIVESRKMNILLQLTHCMSKPQLVGNMYQEEEARRLANDIDVSQSVLIGLIAKSLSKGESTMHTIKDYTGEALSLLVELFTPKIRLVCIGDNYDVNAFADLTKLLGWDWVVVGRKRKMNKNIFNNATAIYEIEDKDKLNFDEFTAVVLMSHDYKIDFDFLQFLNEQELPYIGMLGPKKRTDKMQKQFAEEKIPVDLQSILHLHSPVGLDIGAKNPEEIALSIASEIIATFNKRSGGFLKLRKGPIHKRD